MIERFSDGWTYKRMVFLGLLLLSAPALWIYHRFDPSLYFWFPKCQLYSKTGWQCPFCGTQRAIHNLLNGDLISAIQHNAFFVAAIIYLFGRLMYQLIMSPDDRELISSRQVWIGTGLLIIFTLSRNIL